MITNQNANFVVLRRLNGAGVFYTRNIPGRDPRFLQDGQTKAYEVVAYTLTAEEAEAIFALSVPQFLLRGFEKLGAQQAGAQQARNNTPEQGDQRERVRG